jgi:hypothetical protein
VTLEADLLVVDRARMLIARAEQRVVLEHARCPR